VSRRIRGICKCGKQIPVSSTACTDCSYAYNLRLKYGITIDDYNAMLTKQKGGCQICGCEPRPGSRLQVDHDHVDGKVRGLLCNRCNTICGWAEDDAGLLEEAAGYVRGHSIDRWKKETNWPRREVA
jgi:hypothetical protein